MSKKKHIFLTMFISFLAVLLHCFISLYLTPKITNNVGVEAYGFVNLAKQFTSYGTIIMTALNSYAARYMSVSYMQGRLNEYKRYYNTVLFGDLVIGGILFVIGLVCIINLEHLLQVPIDVLKDVKLLFFLTFLTFYFTTVSTVFFTTGHVKDRLDIVNSIKGLSYVVEILILIFAYAFCRPTVWYVGLATLAAALILFFGTAIMTKRLIPDSKIKVTLFDFASMRKLVVNGFWNAANSMGNALNTGLDLLVSNILLSALSMGQVSIAKTINGMIYTLYSTIAQPFQPAFLRKYSDNDLPGLIRELKYSMKVCGIITNVIFAGFCVLGLQFYKLWIPSQDTLLVHRLTVLAMLPCISEGCVYPLYYIYTLTVKNKVPCIITIIGGLSNVLAMFLLIRFTDMGVYSIVVTTAVIMNVINFITNPLYMCHCLRISKKTFYPNIFLNVLCCGSALVAMQLIVHFMPRNIGWGYFFLQVVVCTLAGATVQILIGFKPSEILQILKRLSSKLHIKRF